MKTIISSSLVPQASTSSMLGKLTLSPKHQKMLAKKFTVGQVIEMMESQIFADFYDSKGEFTAYIEERPTAETGEAIVQNVHDQLVRASRFTK